MKRGIIISIIISILCLIAIPITILSVGFLAPAQFDETYYGELSYMFNRLKKGEEGKIILIGNSSLAFGVRSDLMSEELNREVVIFGLYGAIGTKAMMDLSKVGISKNDIVVLIPEISEQSMSLYFSSAEMWKAFDGHFDMLNYIASENKQSMVGNYTKFVSDKFSYLIKGSKPFVDGVYSQKSFNIDGKEVGYMTYDRPYNIMLNGYNIDNKISFDTSYLTSVFVDYVNDYQNYVHKKGASLYYGFGPINNLAVASSEEDIDQFYDALLNNFNCEVIGNPHNYIFDYEWFYDNNVHLNSSGTYAYTYRLVEDLKIILDDGSYTNIEIPEKPTIPVPEYEEGDNSDLDCFIYEDNGDTYSIVGLTEEGATKTSIIIPSTKDEKPIVSFAASTFQNNENISEIIIPKNTRGLFDYCFDGCKNLTKIVLQHDNPNKINVGMALLQGADNCKIYVKELYYDNFVNHYNWGYYRDKIKKY